MLLPIVALIAVIIAYQLFIKGLLFKLIIAVIFPIAVRFWLLSAFPASAAICLTIASISISWAMVIPMAIVLLALLTTSAN